jgi:UDP-glucose 4-epimerase
MSMRVVVTGGAGFIGANLCRELSGSPSIAGIAVIDDLSTGLAESLSGIPRTQLIVGSILENNLLDDVFDGTDAVVHLAARPSVPRSLTDPLATHHANATGTLEVLDAAKRQAVRHVIVASSSSVYGANPTLPKSEAMLPAPVSPYAASKAATEAYAGAYARSFGLEVLTFRFFNVFGPLQSASHAYAAVVPSFISAALEGRPVRVFGDGFQTRDFTYVESVTRVLRAALDNGVTHDGPVNLAFGSRTSLLGLASIIEELVDEPMQIVHEDPRVGDVRHSQADDEELRRLFPGLEAVPLREGLVRTIDWFRTGEF